MNKQSEEFLQMYSLPFTVQVCSWYVMTDRGPIGQHHLWSLPEAECVAACLFVVCMQTALWTF